MNSLFSVIDRFAREAPASFELPALEAGRPLGSRRAALQAQADETPGRSAAEGNQGAQLRETHRDRSSRSRDKGRGPSS